MNDTAVVRQIVNHTPIETNDPYKTRWGFNGVVREKLVEPLECGMKIVPFAEFFPITSFNTRRENHTTDDTKEKEYSLVIPAADAEHHLLVHLGGKNELINVPDWGFQTGFYGEEDAGKMKVISRTLLPDLPTIRKIVKELKLENPIGDFCAGQEDLNFDERQTCPTCWLNWLLSDSCAAYASHISKEGMQVIEEDYQGNRTKRTVKPAVAELRTARELITESLRKGLIALQAEWNGIVGEVDDKIRQKIVPYQHGIRRDLHAAVPSERQMQVVQEYAKINAQAAAEGSGKMEAVVEKLAEITMQNSQLIQQLVKEKEVKK